MSSAPDRGLDQAWDIRGLIFDDTAKDYDSYLKVEYEENFADRGPEWKRHYNKVQRSIWESYSRLLTDGVKRENMNVAIVGPGMNPVDRDFNRNLMEVFLQKVRTLVVMDFSRKVVQSSITQLINQGGINQQRIYGMLFDITGGMSTAYDRFILNKLAPAMQGNDEEVLVRITDELAHLSQDDFRDQLTDQYSSLLEERTPADLHNFLLQLGQGSPHIRGTVNEERTLRLSIDGEPLNIDLWIVPMVLSGTGAATEDKFWELYHTCTSDPGERTRPESFDVNQERAQMHRNIYKVISWFNTRISEIFLKKVLTDNPHSRVLLISDVSTVLEVAPLESLVGAQDRLNVPTLRENLSESGINLIPLGNPWKWKDEPEHHHGVSAFEVVSSPNGKRKTKTAEVSVTGEIHTTNGGEVNGSNTSPIKQNSPEANDQMM